MLIIPVRDYCLESVIHGHHIYNSYYLSTEIGEILCCEQERSNHADSYEAGFGKTDQVVTFFISRNIVLKH